MRRRKAEEYEKLRGASNRDVHDVSRDTTLPFAREIVALLWNNSIPPWLANPILRRDRRAGTISSDFAWTGP